MPIPTVPAMTWPDRVILGILDPNADKDALLRAVQLAHRWAADLHVVAGYHPPTGTFPHIVTNHEHAAARAAVEEAFAGEVQTVDRGSGLMESPSTSLTVVPDSQLEHALITSSCQADLLLLCVAPTRLRLFARRRRARAERLIAAARCPASLVAQPSGGVDDA